MEITQLWAVHVLGPDDIVAAPSKQAAEKAAAEITARFASPCDPTDVPISGVCIPWPYNTSAHARDVAEFEEYFGEFGQIEQPGDFS